MDSPSTDSPSSAGGACPNCSATLKGEWCHACGQKRLNPEHGRIRWLLAEFVGKLTSLDGKLPRSLMALAFQPGRLGLDWLAGRRARWASPFGLFLVVNLLYFLSPPITDFNLHLYDQLDGQAYSGWALEQVDARFPGLSEWIDDPSAAAPPDGYRSFESRFERRSEGLSKSLLIIHVPLLALALLLLHRKRRVNFVDHFVIATHHWTFLLLVLMVAPRVSTFLSGRLFAWGLVGAPNAGEMIWKLGTVGLIALYLAATLRRAYGQSWAISAVKAVPAFVACAVAHFVYRAVLFTLTLWLV